MTLRDYFAAASLTGLMLSSADDSELTPAQYAQMAYVQADAMLREGNR